MPLDYVDNNAFSGVMNKIGMEKLSLVVDNLLNDKAAELLGIPNELWKHCSEKVLTCLLRLLNLCLSQDVPIILVNTVCKILSKILFDQILLACSKFNVFCNDYFLVLKDTSIQSPIFAIGSVLVLQDMCKVYDLVDWHHLVIIDFGLSNGYRIQNRLDQGEVFSPLLWRIFYDSLLCEVKRHKLLCGYRINSRFMAKFGKIKTSGGKIFFLAAGAFNIMVRKSLRAKASLPCDFPSEVLHHLSLYGLKLFKQVQFERKLASLISFSNSHSILRHLFVHRFLDLQVLGWSLLDLLQFFVRLCVSLVSNFLAGVVKIFLENKLSLTNNLPFAFCGFGNFLMSGILGQFLYFKSVLLLKCFGVVFDDRLLDKKGKQLDSRGPVLHWFLLAFDFMIKSVSLGVRTTSASRKNVLSVLDSDRFFDVYDNGFLIYAGSAKVAGGMAAYFLAVDAGIGIRVAGLLSSTLTKLQAVVLALESKNISIKWVKVKEHSGVVDNIKADVLANKITSLSLSLPVGIRERFLVAKGTAVSGNACYFVRDLYWSICRACWEAGSSFDIVPDIMIREIDWGTTAAVWHFDSHMLFEFTSRKSANLHTYLMNTVYRWLLVAVRKKLYKRSYPECYA
ncbi:hypothetical protein G9A89_000776 [Geosiphon pyriformis]|nr:hypothetical protein G9A89_000776 [Geosiphon pyriformis]